MKITEITNDSRKTIKYIQDLYLSYSINNEKYNELLDFISNTDNISDVSVLKEIDIIRSKLHDEVIKILRK